MGFNTSAWNRIRYTFYQPFYDLVAVVFKPFRRQSVEELELKTTDRILLLGAGTGLDLEFLQDSQHITAVDITPSMIQKLKSRASSLGLNVDARVMDAHHLEFEDESFDVVIMHLIVAVIPDPVQCLKEAERVLKPGGSFSIMDKFIDPGTKPSLIRRILNPITDTLFSSIDRDVDALLAKTSLIKTSDKKLRSIFRLIKGQKPA